MTTLHEVHAFLLGESALDGVWFGDRHPTRRGAFWWRSVLLEAIAQEQATHKPASCRETWKCSHTWKCDNCGKGITLHEGQRYCHTKEMA